MSPSLLDFLQHILHECSYIIRETENKTFEDITGNETLSKAVVRSLEIIGEASKKLPDEFRSNYPQIHWDDMAGMRDVLIHDYFGIDYDVVWNTVKHDIPDLHHELQRIIEMESRT